MHHSYEKAGLVIDDQPIPWNADAVIVECLARVPASAVRRKDEFVLRIPGREPVPLDSLRKDESQDRCRLFFRLAPPSKTTKAEVIWRHHRLSELTLPVVDRAAFLAQLQLQSATLAVQLGYDGQTVSCQTFISTQCRGVIASSLLSSATSLTPLVDLDFHVDWRREGDAHGQHIPVRLSSSQLKGKQALLTVCPPDLPKKAGIYVASWKIDDHVLATQRIKAITKGQFLRSLRVSDTRLVVQTGKGEIRLARQMPSRAAGPHSPRGAGSEGKIARIGPCFLVSSSEMGMAGLCPLSVHGQVAGGIRPVALLEQELLVTDGPAPFVPGTIEVGEVDQLTAFELRAGTKTLGILPLTSAPTAAFNAEGGFKALPAYAWSSAAEDQLQEKLAKLLNGRK